MTVIPDDFGQVNLYFTGTGLPNGAQITFGVSVGALTPGTVCTQVQAALTAGAFASMYTSGISLVKVRAKNGPGEDGPFAELGLSIPGTNVGNVSASAASYLIRKNTLYGGRRGSGRFYWPGVPEDVMEADGTIKAASRTGFDTKLAAFLASLTTNSIPMYLLHGPEYKWDIDSNGQPRRVPQGGAVPPPSLVQSLVCDSRPGTQRRRNRG